MLELVKLLYTKFEFSRIIFPASFQLNWVFSLKESVTNVAIIIEDYTELTLTFY